VVAKEAESTSQPVAKADLPVFKPEAAPVATPTPISRKSWDIQFASGKAVFTPKASETLDVLLKESTPEQGAEDLARVTALMQQFPDLQRAFTNPAIPAARKRALINELLPKLSLSAPVGKLLLMLAERDRLVLLPDLVTVYQERLEDLRQVVRAEVTTAAPLAPERLSSLQQRLADATGRTVKVTTKVDPSMIGGVRAKIGGTVYDGSIATQLEAFRQKLEGTV
jgi:F-type H+-transporting ATPase subunit delta